MGYNKNVLYVNDNVNVCLISGTCPAKRIRLSSVETDYISQDDKYLHYFCTVKVVQFRGRGGSIYSGR